MQNSLGKRRGLMKCSTSRGAFNILALDQRGSLKKAINPADPQEVPYQALVDFKKHIIASLAGVSSAVLLDPEYGAAQNLSADTIPGSTGLIVALEETGYTGENHARQSKILPGWNVEKARKIGADAVKLLIYFHPQSEHAQAQRSLVKQVASNCQDLGLAFFLEPLIHSVEVGKKKVSPSDRRKLITEMAHELSQLGPDVLKLEFPVDIQDEPDELVWLDACQEISSACSVPWVLLSAGVDFDVFLRQVITATSGGASGVMVGRAVWKEAIGLDADERENFLKEIALERMSRLKSVCDRLARPWFSYFPQPEIKENWYQEDY